EIRLGRRQVLRGAVLDRGELRAGRFPEQRPDRLLRLVVLPLALLDLADVAALVDQVFGRPGVVLVGRPGVVAVVDRDRAADAELARRLADVRAHVLERELRRMHADDREAGLPVALVPGLEVRKRAQAVDAGV